MTKESFQESKQVTTNNRRFIYEKKGVCYPFIVLFVTTLATAALATSSRLATAVKTSSGGDLGKCTGSENT